MTSIKSEGLHTGIGKFSILIALLAACLVTACASIGLREETEARGSKFSGTHAALARCVVDALQSDNRWIVRALQYEVRRYPEIETTEIHAYPPGVLPGLYARTSPDNPDAVIRQAHPMEIHSRKPPPAITRDVHPDYSFVLTLKRTDNATVYANLNGKKYEGGVAWEKLGACAR